MPAPTEKDIRVVRGTAKTLRITVTRNGSPVDLALFTGANRRGNVKRSRQSTDVDAVFSFTEETPPGTDGVLLATLVASQSALLDCNSVYDVEIEADADPEDVIPLATGKLFVDQTTNEDPP